MIEVKQQEVDDIGIVDALLILMIDGSCQMNRAISKSQVSLARRSFIRVSFGESVIDSSLVTRATRAQDPPQSIKLTDDDKLTSLHSTNK